MTKNSFVGEVDGVKVEKSGKDFLVEFPYSDTLLKKIRFLVNDDVGALFNKEIGKWQVPGKLEESLGKVVENMREFTRNGGVQVTQMPDGIRYVEFDYNKQLAEIAGAIAGAEFDKEVRAWRVPGDSVALKAIEGKEGSASYFDRAIHDMRTAKSEIDSDLEKIRTLAVGYGKTQGKNPGLTFDHSGNSRSGLILEANKNFALQLAGQKNDVVFLAVHKQDALDNALMKGDEVYISYDEKGHKGSVRTMEVFKEQQTEREGMRGFANSKMTDAKVLNANTKDSSRYEGNVIKVGKHFAMQNTGRGEFTLHNMEKLSHKVLENSKLSISYKNGEGTVIDKSQKKVAGVER